MPNEDNALAINQGIIDWGFVWEKEELSDKYPGLLQAMVSDLTDAISGAEVHYVVVVAQGSEETRRIHIFVVTGGSGAFHATAMATGEHKLVQLGTR